MAGRIMHDGPRGWAVVFAAFTTHLITHGIVYSYGILFIVLEDVFHGTKAEVAWIASITTSSLYLTGPLASIFLRRHGSRMVSLTGTILSAFGCGITILSPNLYFMYFSLGFLTGVGYGLIFIPAVVEVTVYFKKYRGLACGAALSGAGAGAFVFNPLIEYLLVTYGWRGTLLICTGLLLNCVPCSLVFRNKFTTAEEVGQKNEQLTPLRNFQMEVIVESKDDETNQEIGNPLKTCSKAEGKDAEAPRQLLYMCEDESKNTNNIPNASVTDQLMTNSHGDCSLREQNKSLRISSYENVTYPVKCLCCNIPDCSIFQIFQRREMILFYSSQVLFFIGFYFPLIGIPDMALKYGHDERQAVWIVSVCGFSTLAGRILLGFLSDRSFMNSVQMYKVALLVAGISTTLVPVLNPYATLILYAIIYGSSTAVMLSQTTVVLVEILGLERMSDAMGLNNMFSGLGALLGPPVLGLLYDGTSSYTYPFIVSGLSMALGAILLFLMQLCTVKCSRK